MPARPLLVFDTGVGGLSVLAEIRKLLPTAPIVYVADRVGFPYGTKSPAEVAARVPALLGRLAERYDPALIVIACNTASTIALDAARAGLEQPSSHRAAIKPAASVPDPASVYGTAATSVQPYATDWRRVRPDCRAPPRQPRAVELARRKCTARRLMPRVCPNPGGLLGQQGGDGSTRSCSRALFPTVEASSRRRPRPVAVLNAAKASPGASPT